MSSSFPTRLSDDYVPPAYLRDPEADDDSQALRVLEGDALRLIAFRSGDRVLAVTELPTE